VCVFASLLGTTYSYVHIYMQIYKYRRHVICIYVDIHMIDVYVIMDLHIILEMYAHV